MANYDNKKSNRILNWLLLITLSLTVVLLIIYGTREADKAESSIISEQQVYAETLHNDLDQIDKKINYIDVSLLSIYTRQSLNSEEKIQIYEALRALEGSVDNLSRSIDQYNNDITPGLHDFILDSEFNRAKQGVVHTTRLVRIVDSLLLLQWTTQEHREVLVDHFNTARWSLENIAPKL